jgi:uncharacterized membrane protein YgcG
MALESSLFVRPATATVEVQTSSTVAITPPLQLKNSGRFANGSPKQTDALAVVEINKGTPPGSNFSNFLLKEVLIDTSNLNLANTRQLYNIENIVVAQAEIYTANSALIVNRRTVFVYQDGLNYGLQTNLLKTNFTTTVFKVNAAETVTPTVVQVETSRNQTIIIPRILSITPVECIKTTNSTPTGGTGASGGTGGGGGGEGGGGTGVTAFWS